MALTDVRIRNAKPGQERYRLSDSHGLSIEISPRGGKYWRYRYRIGGKENIFAAGEWCQPPAGETGEAAETRRASGGLTLAEARAARVVWRGLVRIGQHPRLARQAARLAAVRTQANTFQALADEFVDKRGRKWTKPHRDRFRRFMARDVFAHIGHLPISTISAAQVLGVLRIVEERGTIQAANLGRGFIGAVFRYAVATQKATVDPVPSLRGALATAERKHHQPLDRGDIKPFLEAVASARADRATEIAVLVAPADDDADGRVAMRPVGGVRPSERRVAHPGRANEDEGPPYRAPVKAGHFLASGAARLFRSTAVAVSQ